MNRSMKHGFRPVFDCLDQRDLPAVGWGVTAQLVGGVLAVTGSNHAAPIRINLMAQKFHGNLRGSVVVAGVGSFQASQIRAITIVRVPGEALVIHRNGRWAPPTFVTVKPVSVAKPPVTYTPTPTPTPTSTGVSTASGATLSPVAQEMVDLTNQMRVQNGLPPLAVDSRLMQMAQIQASNMAQFNDLDHTLPQASLPDLQSRASYVGYSFSSLGENIAYNYLDAGSVVSGWMGSPGHRANILGASYTQIGVAVVADGAGNPYFCEVFGAPQ